MTLSKVPLPLTKVTWYQLLLNLSINDFYICVGEEICLFQNHIFYHHACFFNITLFLLFLSFSLPIWRVLIFTRSPLQMPLIDNFSFIHPPLFIRHLVTLLWQSYPWSSSCSRLYYQPYWSKVTLGCGWRTSSDTGPSWPPISCKSRMVLSYQFLTAMTVR